MSGGEDSYECENCGAFYHTVLPSWWLPRTCWKCGERNPWSLVPDVGVL